MKSSVSVELRRQGVHFLGIAFVLASYVLEFRVFASIVLLAMVVSATAAWFYPLHKKIPVLRHIASLVWSFAREEEKKARVYIGATTFFMGLFIILISFQSLELFRVAALVLVLGDSFSTAIGKAFGKHKLFFNKAKSWEGSIAGFVAAFLGLLTQVSWELALLAALVGMIVESLPLKINDNLTIPVVVGLIVWLFK